MNEKHAERLQVDAFADDAFRQTYAERIGIDESTLREHAILEPSNTVVRDVERLRSAPAISSRISLSGHVYDLEIGIVEIVGAARRGDRQTGGDPA